MNALLLHRPGYICMRSGSGQAHFHCMLQSAEIKYKQVMAEQGPSTKAIKPYWECPTYVDKTTLLAPPLPLGGEPCDLLLSSLKKKKMLC